MEICLHWILPTLLHHMTTKEKKIVYLYSALNIVIIRIPITHTTAAYMKCFGFHFQLLYITHINFATLVDLNYTVVCGSVSVSSHGDLWHVICKLITTPSTTLAHRTVIHCHWRWNRTLVYSTISDGGWRYETKCYTSIVLWTWPIVICFKSNNLLRPLQMTHCRTFMSLFKEFVLRLLKWPILLIFCKQLTTMTRCTCCALVLLSFVPRDVRERKFLSKRVPKH